MTTNPCAPNSGPALDYSNPCSLLPLYRQALFTLMTGSGQAEVRHGESTLRFHPANVKELRAEVQRLETMCNANGTVNNAGRAMGTPRRPRGSLDFPSGYGRYR